MIAPGVEHAHCLEYEVFQTAAPVNHKTPALSCCQPKNSSYLLHIRGLYRNLGSLFECNGQVNKSNN